jgi:PelA/Pel-15E family pectate lyase
MSRSWTQSGATLQYLEQVALFLALIGFVSALGAWWNVYELGADEGINLQKAALIANGHQLYSEIWSDQPPVLSYVLSMVHSFFPFSVAAARVTILLFSAILIVSLFRVILRFEGRIAAWAGVLVVVSGQTFLALSVSVLIGLPAIALTMLALDILTSGSGRSVRAHVVAGGIVFAFAVLTKLFVLLVFPAMIVATWVSANRSAEGGLKARVALESVALFIGSAVVVAVAAVLAVGTSNVDQLVAPHMMAQDVAGYAKRGGVDRLLQLLNRNSTAALYFGLAGAFLTLVRRSGARLIPLAWLAFGFLVLSLHRPLWPHHPLILVIPLGWLGGVVVATASRAVAAVENHIARHPLADSGHRVDSGIGFVGFAVILAALSYGNLDKARSAFAQGASTSEQMAQARLRLYLDDTEHIVTDKPIDAYRLGRLVPPAFAVWSAKRVATGNMSSAEIIKFVAAFPATQVSLRRFDHDTDFLQRIGAHLPGTGPATGIGRLGRFRHFMPATVSSGSPSERSIEDSSAERGNEPSAETHISVTDLLERLPSLGTEGLGGLWDDTDGLRYDRPGSSRPLSARSVVTRPPGSAQELGACFLEIWRQTGDLNFLFESTRIGESLACAQTRGGGWKKTSVLEAGCPTWEGRVPRRRLESDRGATFDDGAVASALYFAFELRDAFDATDLVPPNWLDEMIQRGLHFVVTTQNAEGSWPQSIGLKGYHEFPTLNDDAMTGLIRLMLRAYRRSGHPGYLATAQRAGHYLLRVQGPADQAAFAQQYSAAGVPAPARKFEPAAYSSLETAYAINALIDLYLETADEVFRAAAERGVDWLRRSQISSGQWARFYDIDTNTPIFSDRKGNRYRRLRDIPQEEQSTYRWSLGRDVSPDIGTAIDRMDLLSDGRNAVRRYDKVLEGRSLLPLVPTARASFEVWPLRNERGAMVSTRRFVEDCASLLAPFKSSSLDDKTPGYKQEN